MMKENAKTKSRRDVRREGGDREEREGGRERERTLRKSLWTKREERHQLAMNKDG